MAGATAVFAIFEDYSDKNIHIPSYLTPKPDDPSKSIHITVGNIGDSRLIVGNPKTKSISVMTKDHKPSLPEELQRIIEAGGIVTSGRVGAKLAVSRAIGDHQYKQNPSLPADKQKVNFCQKGKTLLTNPPTRL